MVPESLSAIFWGSSPSLAAHHQQGFQDFLEQSPRDIEKLCKTPEGRLKHVISSEHFDLDLLETLCTTAYTKRESFPNKTLLGCNYSAAPQS